MFRSFVYVNEAALRRYAEQLALGEKKLAARKVSLAAKAGPLQAGADSNPMDVISHWPIYMTNLKRLWKANLMSTMTS